MLDVSPVHSLSISQQLIFPLPILLYILNNNLILRIKQSLSQLEQIQPQTYFGSVPRRDRLGFYAEIQIIFGPAALLRPSQQLVLKN